MQPIVQRQRAMNAYAQASDTMAPALQIVMLYDSAIRRVKEARQAIVERRIEDRYHAVMKAYAIANALHGCLDFDNGGEIAPILDRYYRHIMRLLTEINLRNETSLCDQVLTQLEEMRDSWATIASSAEGRAEPARPPARASGMPALQT